MDFKLYNKCFLKELYDIMNEFNIHRIYRVSINSGKLIEAHQPLKASIGHSEFGESVSKIIKKYCPDVYFDILYRIYIRRYKNKLKKLLNKYDVSIISIDGFCVYQGIYISNDSLHINGVDIITNDNNRYRIDKFELKISD